MSNSKAPQFGRANQFPLSGGDYVDDGSGLKQVGKPTAPPVPKSQRQAEAAAAARADNGDPDTIVPPRPDKTLVGDKLVKSA